MAAARKYWVLCCNCGTITPETDWTYWHTDPETDEWVPAREGEEDPMCKCPACGWEHTDTDGNPGLFNGTIRDVKAERASLISRHEEPWTGYELASDAKDEQT